MEKVIVGELPSSETGYCQSSRWALAVVASNLLTDAMQSYSKEDHQETLQAIKDTHAQIEAGVRQPVHLLTSARLPAACHLARRQPMIPDIPTVTSAASTSDV